MASLKPDKDFSLGAWAMNCRNHRRHPSAESGKSAVCLSDLHPDDTDRILLSIARHFFRDQAFPHRGDDRMATTIADISFGYGRGTAIAAAMHRAIETMRLSRRDAFHYHNPDCPTCSGLLTDAEQLFVQVFRAVRMGRNSAASANAMLLCEGNDHGPFLGAVSQVFHVLSGSRWHVDTETWLTDRSCRP